MDPVDKMEVGSSLSFSLDLDSLLAADGWIMDLGLPNYPGFQIQ